MIQRVRNITPQLASLLQKTINETPACIETLEDIEANVASGSEWLFASDNVVFLCHLIQAETLYLNVSLLGGKDDTLHLWKDELLALIKTLTKETNSKLLIITREGWQRVYPELKQIGCVFTL